MALPNSPLESFIWGAGGAALTPEQIARQREIAAALSAKGVDTSPVGSWTQGAARVADALAGVVKERRADRAEGANATANSGILQSLLQGGASGFPAPPTGGAFPAAPSGAAPQAATASVPQTANAQAIREGLIKRGLPEHVADGFLMNFQDESGLNPGINEQNPTVPGSRGGFGLYQLTGPRRVAYEKYAAQKGVAPSDVDAQLDFMMSELQGPEAGAFKSIMAAPDSGHAAAAIVDNFLRPAETHRAARAASYLKGGAAPIQVASLDPSAGVAQAAAIPPEYAQNGMTQQQWEAMNAPGEDLAPASPPVSMVQPAGDGQPPVAGDAATATPAGQRVLSALMNPQPMGGAPMPMQGAIPPQLQQPVSDPQQQVAQAQDLSQIPVMAGGTSDAIPAGQAQQGINPAIIEALSNPAASPQTQKIAQMLLGKQMEKQAAQNEPLKYDFMAGKDGSIFRTDSSGHMEQVYGGKPDTFRTLTAQEKASMGLPAEGAYQIGADNKISQIGGGGTTVNIDQKSEGAFEKKLAESQAVTFDTMATEGLSARADQAVIGELESALAHTGGTLAGVKGIAARYGIGGEGMDDIQTATALINKLIPSQRQPGSGSMSDRDVEMFTRSLPSLWNTPGGNQKILTVMKGLTQYKQDQGEIADQVIAGEITRQEARKMLRELKNPLADFGKTMDGGGQKKPTVIDGFTIEEVP